MILWMIERFRNELSELEELRGVSKEITNIFSIYIFITDSCQEEFNKYRSFEIKPLFWTENSEILLNPRILSAIIA